jgi:ribosomal protein L18
MAQLGNKLKEKLNKYLQRKNRVNKKIKSHNPETRIIINKSNMYITAQVINSD